MYNRSHLNMQIYRTLDIFTFESRHIKWFYPLIFPSLKGYFCINRYRLYALIAPCPIWVWYCTHIVFACWQAWTWWLSWPARTWFLTGLNMVELASLNSSAGQLKYGWASQLEHGCWQACSCMLEQTVHGLMNEQTWMSRLEQHCWNHHGKSTEHRTCS